MSVQVLDAALADSLRTVAVNGSYNASRALSKWLHKGVRLTSDGFRSVLMSQASSMLGEPDSMLAAIHMPLAGDVTGHLLLAFPGNTGLILSDLLIQQPEGTAKVFEELEQSCLQETGNIVGTAYANSLARWLKLRLEPRVPTFLYDMSSAIIDPLVAEMVAYHDEVFVAETEFLLDGRRLKWGLLLLPSLESLDRMRSCCQQEAVRAQALQTIAVNGSFNASRAMSKWLKRGVKISTEGFTKIPLAEAGNQFDESAPIVTLHLPLSEQMHGHSILAMTEPHAMRLADLLLGERPGTTKELGELEQSSLCETGNIVSSAFVNSWSNWLDICVEPASPQLVIDLPSAVFGELLADQARVSDEVYLARTDFLLDDQALEWVFMLLPSPSAMRLIEAACR